MTSSFQQPDTDAGEFLRSKLLIFWALLTFIGILLTLSVVIGRYSLGEELNLAGALNGQMWRFQMWAALSVVIIWFDGRLRRVTPKWAFLFPAHLAGAAAWSFAASAGMVVLVWFFDGLLNSRFASIGAVAAQAGVGSLVMGIVGYKIILTTNYALDFHRKFNDERNRSAELEKQLAQAQLQALKMQLQPHFLFNTLNSLSSLALEDPRQTVHMIARLGDFLRLTVDSNGTQIVSLEKEIEFLKNYLEIEQIRFRDRLKPTFEIDSEALRAEVPNLILQPAVENAIKHGISKSMDAGRIRVGAKKASGRLVMEVENDGPKQNGTAGNGVGIANTRERLSQIYGDDYEMDFSLLDEGGARLVISIPFRSE
jgi:two-component system LytT family sensor kinase